MEDAEVLIGRVRSSVLLPRDDGYDQARATWNGRIDRRPAAIVRCTGTADVIAGVNFARERELPLSIRGGGHHVTGDAVCDGGLMIDLSRLAWVRVDPAARRALVGPGTRVADIDHETQAFGLATTGAPVSTTGMAGYTLGGGLGWLSRKHGLASDNLVSADVVTAAGELVHASEDENADLFWALRGGGGNFGVVTCFEFRLHEVGPEVLAGPVTYRMEDAAEVLRFYRDFMPEAPDELTCMPVIFRLPPAPGIPEDLRGRTVFALVPFYVGNLARGREAVRPLREVGEPIADEVAVVRYATLLSDLEEMYRAGHRVYYRSAFFDTFPDAAIDALIEHADPVPTAYSSLFLEWMGGAVARRTPDATAFPHRERTLCLTAVPKWEDARLDGELKAWADDLFRALEPYAAEGVYVNYLDHVEGQGARAAYGRNHDRLAALKKEWDPDNLFRINHNIEPSV